VSGVRRPIDDGDWNMAFLFPAEVAAARAQTGLVILPLAPVEWHGPHLTMGCDPLLAHAFARRLARELESPYFPPLYVGTERERRPQTLEALGFGRGDHIEGMDFPANAVKSAYLREEVFALVVRDTVELLFERFGFRRVLIVNGHGADNQRGVLDRLCAEWNAAGGRGSAGKAGGRAGAGGGTRIMWVYPGFPRSLIAGAIGHATAEETSMLASEWPACVDLSRLPAAGPLRNVEHAVVDGDTFDGSPTPDFTVRENQDPRRHTDPARGRGFIEEAVGEVVAEVRAKLLGG
jgi:creatinine amidohydrolase